MPINLRRLSPSSFSGSGRLDATPQPYLDPAAASAGARQVAASAAQLGTATGDALSALVELDKEKRKLERASLLSELVASAETRFYDFESIVKRSGQPRDTTGEPERLGMTTTDPLLHRTYATTIDAGLSEIVAQGAKSTADPLVQDAFLKKMRVFGAERYRQARVYQDKLFVDYHEAALVRELDSAKHRAFRAADDYGIDAGLKAVDAVSVLFEQYRSLIGSEATEKRSKEFREAAGGALARRAVYDTPLDFLPTARRGGGLHEKFEPYVKPEYMASLLKLASEEAERRVAADVRLADRNDRKAKQALENEAQEWASRVFQGFASDDPQTALFTSSAAISDGLAMFGHSLPIETQRAILALRNQPRLQGGVTNPDVQNDLQRRIVMDDPDISASSIMHHVPDRLSTKDSIVLINGLETRRAANDVSKDPFYAAGVKQISIRLSGSDLPAFLAFARMRPDEARRYGDALLLFESAARAMKKQGKPLDTLPELASKIADAALRASPGGTPAPDTKAPGTGPEPEKVKPAVKPKTPRDKTIPR